jgi:ribosomal protein L16/L10AE
MEVKGKLAKKLETRSGEGKNGQWKVAQFVISVKDRLFCFDAWNQHAELLSEAQIGDVLTVDFKINCREYKEKYYTSLVVENLTIVEKASSQKKDDDGLPF